MRIKALALILVAVLAVDLPALALTLYVDVNSTNPVPPYTNWTTAANVIQDAVDAAGNGDTVFVTNGVYDTGGRAVYGTMTNRVAVDKPLTLRSLNGPHHTLIAGHQLLGATNGIGAVRCAYLTNGAALVGFTLTNGATQLTSDLPTNLVAVYGGGVRCESENVVLSNCVFTGNSAEVGGGLYQGTLYNSVLKANTADSGGGAFRSVLEDCLVVANVADFGGGLYDSIARNCVVSNNVASGGGGGMHYGTAIECAIVRNSAIYGGGASNGRTERCLILGNSAETDGGGVWSEYASVAAACIIAGNSADTGGGMFVQYGGSAVHCTFTGNTADTGGGIAGGKSTNCIFYYNTAFGADDNCRSHDAVFSCSPDLANGINGNITNAPLLVDIAHIATNSPCRGAGTAVATVPKDIDGESWSTPPAMGCDENNGFGTINGMLKPGLVGPLRIVLNIKGSYLPVAYGPATQTLMDFGDGQIVTNAVISSPKFWPASGSYPVIVTAFNDDHPAGVMFTQLVEVLPVHAATLYVSQDSGSDTNDGSSWAEAKQSIQAGVNAQIVHGGRVMVTNGLYLLLREISVDKTIVLESLNGAASTIIDGGGAVRCLNLKNTSSLLSGFTITNGYTTGNGGGVFCVDPTPLVTNCVLVGNRADLSGGGMQHGTITHSLVRSNSAGRAGGGVFQAKATQCTLAGNRAIAGIGLGAGGGMAQCTAANCILFNNSAGVGGGISGGTASTCTIVGNTAFDGGGVFQGIANNCILQFNSALPSGENHSGSDLTNCCTSPLPTNGWANVTNAPLFVDTNGWADLRLQSNSPCINSGNNAYVTTTNDLDGKPRISGGTVDMGAYEFQSPDSTISYAWLQSYGLPTDGSVDDIDGDGDKATAWQEWKMWTDPTSQLSVLKMLQADPQANGTAVAWLSVSGHSYTLERAANGATDFSVLQSNIVGQAGTTTFSDTTATNGAAFLYRVGVPE